MFSQACCQIRNAIYGIIGETQVRANQFNCSNATAFMIAPSVLVTAAHSVHVRNHPNQPVHTSFVVIRAPDIGQSMESVELIAEDSGRDIALLRINNPRSNTCVILESNIVSIGTSCGSLGFPLAKVTFSPRTGRMFNLNERFQGANISAFYTETDSSGREQSTYETDALMYQGSSGCPGFLVKGNVFGMHNKAIFQAPRRSSSPQSPQAGIETRLAISLWVPSMDIITFAVDNGIEL
jgi:S1-C subfamily serine protease